MRRLILLVLMFAPFPAFADADLSFGAPWTREDTGRQAFISGLYLYDYAQTRYVGQHCDQWKETGPIVAGFAGECPNLKRLALWNAILIPGHAWLMTRLDRDMRTIFQRTFIVVEGANVYRNSKIGVGVSWPW